MDVQPDIAAVFHAALAMGFCLGVLFAVLVRWQIAGRNR